MKKQIDKQGKKVLKVHIEMPRSAWEDPKTRGAVRKALANLDYIRELAGIKAHVIFIPCDEEAK